MDSLQHLEDLQDPSSNLAAQLKAATGGPSEQIKAGQTPFPQNVTILSSDIEGEAKEAYNHLVDISSVANLYTAIWAANLRSKRGHAEQYDIKTASEAAQSFADIAIAAYDVMGGPLAAFFHCDSTAKTTFRKTVSKTEVHLEFLSEVFKGFSLSKAAMQQLDAILTDRVNSLSAVNVETGSTNNTIDQTLRINQVIRLNISGDEAFPVWVYQPRTRIVYMQIDGSSWTWAVNKANHSSGAFNMTYTVGDYDLNVEKWRAVKGKFDEVFDKVIGKSVSEYGKMVNAGPVNLD